MIGRRLRLVGGWALPVGASGVGGILGADTGTSRHSGRVGRLRACGEKRGVPLACHPGWRRGCQHRRVLGQRYLEPSLGWHRRVINRYVRLVASRMGQTRLSSVDHVGDTPTPPTSPPRVSRGPVGWLTLTGAALAVTGAGSLASTGRKA